MMPTLNAIMWQTQYALHKKPQVVPGICLILASSLIIYRHLDHSLSDGLKQFLVIILAQMLPLVALEMKITSCPDPVGLFCKFATPVTLMHAFFFGMRLVMYPWYDQECLLCSGVFLIGALVAIHKVFHQTWSNIVQCSAVWGLVSLALMASIVTTSMNLYLEAPSVPLMNWKRFSEEVILTSTDYVEIMAFVPAVWMVYSEDQTKAHVSVDMVKAKRISTTFFFLMVGFYVTEDLTSPHLSWTTFFAHLAHFCLLTDFSCYVLAHIYNPEKLVGQLCRWLPSDFYHEV
jgi:hypothetical protein